MQKEDLIYWTYYGFLFLLLLIVTIYFQKKGLTAKKYTTIPWVLFSTLASLGISFSLPDLDIKFYDTLTIVGVFALFGYLNASAYVSLRDRVIEYRKKNKK